MGVSLKLELNTSRSCWLFFLLPLSAVSWLSPAMATVVATATADMVDMVIMDMAATDTMDTTARGKPKLLLLLSPLPMPLLDTDTTAMDTGMDTATDTTARGRLMLMPTTAVDTDTAMATAMATVMDMAMDTDTVMAMATMVKKLLAIMMSRVQWRQPC